LNTKQCYGIPKNDQPAFNRRVIRIEDEMMFLLAMLNTYFERFTAALRMPFSSAAQAFIVQAATHHVATNACPTLTPLPAPVLRLRS
jgi:hypothetical protein